MTIAILGLGNMGKGLAERLTARPIWSAALRSRRPPPLCASRGASVADYRPCSPSHHHAGAALARRSELVRPSAAARSSSTSPTRSRRTIRASPSATPRRLPRRSPARARAPRWSRRSTRDLCQPLRHPGSATASVPVFVAGNDEAAVAAVANLVKAGLCGRERRRARRRALVEPVGMLNIRLGYGLGKGTSIAPTWVKLAA